MALIKCSECGSQVSDKASACIHCGAPLNGLVAEPSRTGMIASAVKPKKQSNGIRNFLVAVILLVVGLIVLGMIAGQSNTNQTSPQALAGSAGSDFAQKTSDASPFPSSTDDDKAAAQMKADSEAAEVSAALAAEHNYSLEQDGEYGYQPGISDADRIQGVVSKPLIMVRYRGVKNGYYTVEQVTEGAAMRLDCKDPCEFIRVRLMSNGRTLDTQTIPNNSGSIAGEIMEDVINEKLRPYKAPGG